MIKVETIRIEEFRGIRDLTLNLKRKNFALCGPNGTGKSGVVDALEFALTGNISRLAGEGTDNLSVKEHAPHVDSRNAPGRAKVTITATIPKLGNKAVTIVRSVSAPSSPTISPKTPETLEVLKQLERHPEFVLTRRELIRYVLSPPGKRAKEIQALLKLDRVEQAREALQKVSNRCQRTMIAAREGRDRAREQLTRALGIPQLTSEAVLEATNAPRVLLGLEPIHKLSATTSLKDGLLGAGAAASPGRIPKAQAAADLAQLRSDIVAYAAPEMTVKISGVTGRLRELAADEVLLANLSRESFLRSGLSLVQESSCPLCDTAWDPAHLRAHIEGKLAKLEDIVRARAEVERDLRPIIVLLGKIREGIDTAIRYSGMATSPVKSEQLGEHRHSIASAIEQLERLLPLSESIDALGIVPRSSAAIVTALGGVETFVSRIPEPTQQDAAREFLTVSQVRLEVYRDAALTVKKTETEADLTRKVVARYVKVSTEVLEGIYSQVESAFGELYRDINREDEAGFTARLTPSLGKLGFDVDFYGRGHFPPGAYHSEGHQDAMGLCLYLALMQHLQSEDFAFAVLDDVLMSVDSGHRREICALLKQRFPNTQFIITTHDPIWLRHMRTEGLLMPEASVQFRVWHVDRGPTEWDDRDVWKEIDSDLGRNDVRAAAALLRHFLEYSGAELCHRLRALVEFHGDAQYQLGDVLPRATTRLKDLYDKGKRSAKSWNQAEALTAVTAQADAFGLLVANSNVEQWYINPAVHYNEWATMQKADFAPVVQAFRNLIGAFQCPNPDCRSDVYVVPDRGKSPEALRCACNGISINLVEK